MKINESTGVMDEGKEKEEISKWTAEDDTDSDQKRNT